MFLFLVLGGSDVDEEAEDGASSPKKQRTAAAAGSYFVLSLSLLDLK